MEDKADFDILFRMYYAPLCSFAHTLVYDWEMSRDIVSDAFEYVWRNFERVDKSTVKSYLYLYVKNRAIDFLRHKDIRDNYAELFLKLEPAYDKITFNEMDERMQLIHAAIETLSPSTRFILEQCYLYEKKYKEVAEELGISTSAVQKHIVKALKQIRERIVKEK